MKTKELFFTLAWTIGVATTVCASGAVRQAMTGGTPEERAAILEEQTRRNGGTVRIGGKGKVLIVHRLSSDMAAAVDRPVAMLGRALRIDIERTVASEEFSVDNAEKLVAASGAQAVVFIVDSSLLPPTLIAPEARWAVVNVAPIFAGVEEERRSCRLGVAFLRTACRLLGSDASRFATSCLAPAGTVADFDRLDKCFITVDTMIAMLQYIEHIGLRPYQIKSYRDACEDGDAPAPTNDVQKAIWEKVKADKERGPTNPITIQPPKAK